jgi:fused signal recognition particle receptor
VHFIGVGEGIDDLAPFAARDFARALAGSDEDPPPREAE